MTVTLLNKQYKQIRVRRAFKQAKWNKGFRKDAPAKATEIANVYTELGIEGNLVAEIKRIQPDIKITKEESYCLISCDLGKLELKKTKQSTIS